jgi:hypothetical protein
MNRTATVRERAVGSVHGRLHETRWRPLAP